MRDLSQTHIEALERLLSSADPSAQLDLPHGFTARREYEAFRIAPRACGGQPEALPLTVPFDGVWAGGNRVKLRKLEKSEVFYKTVNRFFTKIYIPPPSAFQREITRGRRRHPENGSGGRFPGAQL